MQWWLFQKAKLIPIKKILESYHHRRTRRECSSSQLFGASLYCEGQKGTPFFFNYLGILHFQKEISVCAQSSSSPSKQLIVVRLILLNSASSVLWQIWLHFWVHLYSFYIEELIVALWRNLFNWPTVSLCLKLRLFEGWYCPLKGAA